MQAYSTEGEGMSKTFKPRIVDRIPVVDLVYHSDAFSKFNPAEHVASHMAITDNISDNGACIFTPKAYRKGSKLKVSFRGMRKQSLIATVRWCRKSSDRVYRVGLFWPDIT